MKLIFKTFVSGEIEMGMFVSVHSTVRVYTYTPLLCIAQSAQYMHVHCTLYSILYYKKSKI